MSERIDNSRKHGCWIHKRVKNEKSVTGYFILRDCSCSKCGYVAPYEQDRCPRCLAIMDGERKYKDR